MEGKEAVASLCGLVLRRLQDEPPGVIDRDTLSEIFGEALQQFSEGDGLITFVVAQDEGKAEDVQT